MMIRYPDYLAATNAAYKLLLDLNINKLPIDLNYVINKLPNIRLMPYGDICAKRGLQFNDFVKIAENEHGFLNRRYKNNAWQYIIMYNEAKDCKTKRFTIAHELGHATLGHEMDDKILEKEANCFARNLLCPIPISIEKQLFSCLDYVNTYDISSVAADVSIIFRRADFNNITMDNYFDICKLFDVDYENNIENEVDRMLCLYPQTINF